MKEQTKRNYQWKRLKRKVLFHIAGYMPFLSAYFRSKLYRLGGVRIEVPKQTFIGYRVTFDDINPQDITIKPNTIITQGCVILSHFTTGTHKNYFIWKEEK